MTRLGRLAPNLHPTPFSSPRPHLLPLRRFPRPQRSQPNTTPRPARAHPLLYLPSPPASATPTHDPLSCIPPRSSRDRPARPGRTPLGIAAGTGSGREAVAIDVDRAPAAAAHGVACRICHLSPEGGDGPAAAPGSVVIRLGCGCKGELGDAHRHCAEAWFRIKGDRPCEICGSDAKNITGLEVKKFMRNGMDKEWQTPLLRWRGKLLVGGGSPFVN